MSLPDAVHLLDRELRAVFGPRLQSLVAYGRQPAEPQHRRTPLRTLALVASLTESDLRACAGKVPAWHASGLATPLFVAAGEFDRSLDVFPLEFGAIIADHEVISGTEPFAEARVESADIRRACEVQARSHLLHLREGFLEAHGNSNALAVLIVASAPPLAALLTSLARLDGRSDRDATAAARHAERTIGLTSGLAEIAALVKVQEIPASEAERLFPRYLEAVERLVAYVDGWSSHGH
jgi:hypothetical protein